MQVLKTLHLSLCIITDSLKGFTEIYFNFEVLLVNYSKNDEIGELLAALASFRDDINDTEP